MADVRNGKNAASPMDGQSGKSNNIQEPQKSQKSSLMMKVDPPEEESSGCKKEGNRAPFSPVTHGFSSKPVFGNTGKLGSSVMASPRLSSPSFGGNPFVMKPSSFGSVSKFGCATSSPFGLSPSSPKPVFLRPSQLALGNSESPQQATSRSSFPLKPASLGNPFSRVPQDNETTSSSEDSKGGDNSEATSELSKSPSEEIGTNSTSSSKGDRKTTSRSDEDKKAAVESNSQLLDNDSSSSNSSNSATPKNSRGIMAAPKFVPLGTPSRHLEESTNASGNTSTAATSSASGFVFGQNLHERVAEAVTLESTDTVNKSPEAAGTSNSKPSLCATAATNGTSEMLFTSVIKKDHNSETSHSSSNNTSDIGEKPSKSLSEAAREYEEARAVKRKYEEVTIVTGEEDEANVLQMNCKLFAFDKAGGTWVERGRGTLRLNDKDDGPGGGVQSRVVIRTTGSLRVVLNTKIWAGMSVDKPSPKSVRLTAMDNSGQIKVFLVMSSPKETDQLHKSLECRVRKAQQASSQSQTQSEAGTADVNITTHSLPPEPTSKKRPAKNVEETGSSSDVAPV